MKYLFLESGGNFEDVTDDVTGLSCPNFPVPANGKLLFKMKVKSTGGAGDADSFGAGITDGSDCNPVTDLLWAKVKVTD